MAETGLTDLLLSRASGGILPWAEQSSLARETGLSLREIEVAAMGEGIMPARYQSNRGVISTAEQLTLLKAKVAVVGCGGLGGYVIEELARMGVGEIRVWDGDIVEEKNLNRQLLAQFSSLGQSKVQSAAERIKAINPVVQLVGYQRQFTGIEDSTLLAGADVVIDALDNIPSRLLVSRACANLQIPLIHGAVDGWYGQVMTQFPGEGVMERIYNQHRDGEHISTPQPTLSFVPAVIASLETAQALKVILGRGDLLKGKLLAIDLLSMDIDILEIGS